MSDNIPMEDTVDSGLWEVNIEDSETASSSSTLKWGKGKRAEYYREYRAKKRREQERELLNSMINNPTVATINTPKNIGLKVKKKKTPAEYQREYRARQKAKQNGLFDNTTPDWNQFLKSPMMEPLLRESWLNTLNREDLSSSNDVNSVVYSDHCLDEDSDTQPGHTLSSNEILSSSCDVKICRICFATDCKLYIIAGDKKLSQAYQTLVGFVTDSEPKLPQYLCTICAHRVLSCARFRTRTLKAQLLMLDIISKNDCVTLDAIRSVDNQSDYNNLSVANKTDHYDLDIVHVKKQNDTHEFQNTESVNDEVPNSMRVLDKSKDQPKVNNKDIESLHEETVLDVVKIKIENDTESVNDEVLNNIQLDISKDQPKVAHNKDIESLHKETVLDDVKIKIENDSDEGIDDESNEMKGIESLHEETVLDDLKIKIENDGDEGIDDEKDDEMTKTCSHPVVIYIKAEPLKEYSDDDDHLANTSNSKINGDEYPNNGDERRTDETKGEDTPSAGRLNAVKEETRRSCIKDEQLASRSGQIDTQPRLKTIDIRKICHLVPLPKRNKRAKLQSGEKSYSCDICKKTFEYKGSIRKHMRIHSTVKPFSCNICNKSFVIRSKLQRHALTHYHKKRFHCNLCTRTCRSESNLLTHLRIHSGEKPYSCDLCNAAYKDKRDLRKHVKKHSNLKPFSCEICNKSFVIKNKLMRHMKTHSSDKPFSCTVCKKSFGEKSNLQKHVKKHTGVRPYSCDVCNKSFTEKSVLTGHLRIHTGEKPYTCNICERSFSRRGNFIIHLGKHSVEKPYTRTAIKKEPIDNSL